MTRVAIAGKNNPAYKHGHTEGKFSPEYYSWSGMIQRCTNKKRDSWKYYGARGITVCDRWLHSFEGFLNDMGNRPKHTSLDRIDSNKGYYLENCRWATNSVQRTNKDKKTEGYAQDILCLIMLGHGFIPTIVEYMGLHKEVVKKEIRKLRHIGLIITTRQGRTLQCTYTGKINNA